jgi:hypothetical protein
MEHDVANGGPDEGIPGRGSGEIEAEASWGEGRFPIDGILQKTRLFMSKKEFRSNVSSAAGEWWNEQILRVLWRRGSTASHSISIERIA